MEKGKKEFGKKQGIGCFYFQSTTNIFFLETRIFLYPDKKQLKYIIYQYEHANTLEYLIGISF